ncbi:hypothetical protein EI555_000282 [Monodon monoceros]|uniref:Uncharacterized protein n=1 Tax=Monodon monoceros TaxID=40151 RepID=A0A4U1FE71_MONMO|nr:hypothetical protein EI555_000282 [Monodon monoceros]
MPRPREGPGFDLRPPARPASRDQAGASRPRLPPPPLPPRLGREAPLRPLQTSPVTGDCSRPRPRWMRWWTS